MDADRERRHVMFVDDEPATYQLVERSLRDDGVRLTCVGDGAQALQVLERARVDLLITGLTMPVVDGVELLRHVANRRLAIPVIVAAASAPKEASRLGFLREPIEPVALIAAVRERLAATAPVAPIAVAELAQLLALGRRSCALRAHADGVLGQLLFVGGTLVDAAVGNLRGDVAARELLAWTRALLRVDSLPRAREASVQSPLAALLPAPGSLRFELPASAPTSGSADCLTAGQVPGAEESLTAGFAPGPEDSLVGGQSPVPADSLVAGLSPVPRDSLALAPIPEDGPAPVMNVAPARPPPAPADVPAWERPEAQGPISALLTAALTIDGALGAALAVWELGHALGVQAAEGPLGLDGMRSALAGNCRVMRAMMSMMTRLGRRPEVHDILITLDDQLHVLVPLPRHDGLFLHLVLASARTNLGLARVRAQRLVAEFELAAAPQ